MSGLTAGRRRGQPFRFTTGLALGQEFFTTSITVGLRKSRALNHGLLPDGYYALREQFAAGFGPDVLTLQGVGDDFLFQERMIPQTASSVNFA